MNDASPMGGTWQRHLEQRRAWRMIRADPVGLENHFGLWGFCACLTSTSDTMEAMGASLVYLLLRQVLQHRLDLEPADRVVLAALSRLLPAPAGQRSSSPRRPSPKAKSVDLRWA